MQMTRNPELQTSLNLKPEPEITSVNLTFMLKARKPNLPTESRCAQLRAIDQSYVSRQSSGRQ